MLLYFPPHTDSPTSDNAPGLGAGGIRAPELRGHHAQHRDAKVCASCGDLLKIRAPSNKTLPQARAAVVPLQAPKRNPIKRPLPPVFRSRQAFALYPCGPSSFGRLSLPRNPRPPGTGRGRSRCRHRRPAPGPLARRSPRPNRRTSASSSPKDLHGTRGSLEENGLPGPPPPKDLTLLVRLSRSEKAKVEGPGTARGWQCGPCNLNSRGLEQ